MSIISNTNRFFVLFALLFSLDVALMYAHYTPTVTVLPTNIAIFLEVSVFILMIGFFLYFLDYQKKTKKRAVMLMVDVLSFSEDAVVALNAKNEIIGHNSLFAALCAPRYPEDGKNILEIIPTSWLSEWQNALQTLQIESKTQIGESHAKTFDFESVIFSKKEDSTLVVCKKTHPLANQQHFLPELQARNKELSESVRQLHQTQDMFMQLQEELKDKEANLTAMIDNLEDVIVSVDFKYKVLSMNKAFRESYRRREIVVKKGLNLLKIVPSNEVENLKKNINKALDGNRFTVIEEFKNYFEQTEYYETTFNPMENDEGIIIGVAFFSKNITLRRLRDIERQKFIAQLEEQTQALQEKEENLQISVTELQSIHEKLTQTNSELGNNQLLMSSVLDNLVEGVLAIDTNYNIIVINRSMKERYAEFGVMVEVGYNVFTLILPEQIPYWKAACDKAMQGEAVTTIDKVNNSFFDMMLNPIFDLNNKIIGVSVLARDISRQIKTTEKNYSKPIDLFQRIQDTSNIINETQESEIAAYRKKVEDLKREISKK